MHILPVVQIQTTRKGKLQPRPLKNISLMETLVVVVVVALVVALVAVVYGVVDVEDLGRGGKGRSDDRTCYYCGKPGHFISICKIRIEDERSGRIRNPNNRGGQGGRVRGQFIPCSTQQQNSVNDQGFPINYTGQSTQTQ